MSRITRSATAAPSAAASRMPIRPPKCPASRVTCDAEIAVIGKAGARDHRGRRFLPGRADHRARSPTRSSPRSGCRPGRRRGAGASRSSRAAAAISRWPASRCSTMRTRRQGAQRPCRRDRRRRPAAAACGRRKRRSTARRSTRRSIAKVGEPPRRRRSIRRTTSTPAPPIAARSPARWSSARSRPRRRSVNAMPTKFEVNGKPVERRRRAAHDAGRLPAPRAAAHRHPCRLRARRLRRLHRAGRRRGGALLPDARGAGRRREGRHRRGPVATTTT